MAIINGNPGADTLDGGAEADVISGGTGGDLLQGLGGADTIYGHDASHLSSDGGSDTLLGGQGNDHLYVSVLDEARGGEGDDRIVIHGGGADAPLIYAYGDAGTDIVVLAANSGLPAGVTISMAWEETPSALIRLKDVEVLDLGDFNSAHVYGSKNNETILGSFQSDTIMGGQGDDVIAFRGGSDVIDGGEGEDTLSLDGVERAASGITFKLHLTEAQEYGDQFGEIAKVTVRNVEHVNGSIVADRIEGSEGANRLDGRNGDDYLYGMGGNDTALGGQGHDHVYGGADNDQLFGDAGKDTLAGEAGADTLDGGADADRLEGGEGADSLFGGSGRDSLYGGAGADTLDGGADEDALYGGEGNDYIDGRVGNNGEETLSGGAGNDTIMASWSNDVMIGGAGADLMVGDNLTGYSASQVSYEDATAGVQIDRVRDSSAWTGDAKGDTLQNIHRIKLTEFGDVFYGRGGEVTGSDMAFRDDIEGGGGGDTIYGMGGLDNLSGGEGNDVLYGGAGQDILDGGAGDDYLHAGEGPGGSRFDTGSGNDTFIGGSGNDHGTDSGGTTPAGSGNDRFELGAGDDTLNLTGGHDTVYGGSGADNISQHTINGDQYIDGGDGNDSIDAGNGADTILGGAGDDNINLNGSGAKHVDGGAGNDIYRSVQADTRVIEQEFLGGEDTFELAATFKVTGQYVLQENIENLNARLVDRGLNAVGNNGHNQMIGSIYNDTLSGGHGDDILRGGRGNDVIDGGLDGIFSAVGDTAEFSGDFKDYRFETLENGDLKVTDTRSGNFTDGVDILRNIERLSFLGDKQVRTRGELANTPPKLEADAVAVDEDATSGNLYDLLLSNDSDANDDEMFIVGIGTQSTLGTVVLDTTTKTLTYAADDDAFDHLKPGETATDTFTYQVRDKVGAVSTQTVTVTINGKNNADDWTDLTEGADNRVLGDGADKVRGLGGADSINGGGGDDVLDGGEGADTLSGGGGADVLTGGLGDDVIKGGLGDKTLAGGGGVDRGDLDFSGATTGVRFEVSANLNGVTNVLGTEISGFERVNFQGGQGADYLVGGALDDDLFGNDGNDTLSGGGGNDRMFGGAGDDTYVVTSVSQILTETTGVDTIQTTLSNYGLAFAFENLEAIGGGARWFTGNQADNRITGGTGNDTLDGGAGADTLVGGDGADRLLGGAGADVLTGGAGKDRFVFNTVEGDVITDWAAGDIIDVLGLEAYGLRLTRKGENTEVTFDLDGDGQFDDAVMTVLGSTVKSSDFEW